MRYDKCYKVFEEWEATPYSRKFVHLPRYVWAGTERQFKGRPIRPLARLSILSRLGT